MPHDVETRFYQPTINAAGDTTFTYDVKSLQDIESGANIESIKDISIYAYKAALMADDKANGGNENFILDENELMNYTILESGAYFSGLSAKKNLEGHTFNDEYITISNNLNIICNMETSEMRSKAVKDFFKGYNNDTWGVNGFFEQMASEWGAAMTNGQAAKLLKAVLDSIPEGEQRYCDEYGYVNKMYNLYSSKDPDKTFRNSFWGGVARQLLPFQGFGADRLDKLDEAIKNLYKD